MTVVNPHVSTPITHNLKLHLAPLSQSCVRQTSTYGPWLLKMTGSSKPIGVVVFEVDRFCATGACCGMNVEMGLRTLWTVYLQGCCHLVNWPQGMIWYGFGEWRWDGDGAGAADVEEGDGEASVEEAPELYLSMLSLKCPLYGIQRYLQISIHRLKLYSALHPAPRPKST